MGGNSPSRFPAEDEAGAATFVKGIRLSDRVISRMKASSHHVSPEPHTEQATPVSVGRLSPLQTPPSTPSQEGIFPSPPVGAAPPVKLTPPPPVTFHSLPPPSLKSPGTTPSLDAQTSSAPSLRAEHPQVPESPSPPSVLEQVPPLPESLITPHKDPETQITPQIEERVKEPVSLFPSGDSSPSSELSSPSSEFVKSTPTEPAAVESAQVSASNNSPAPLASVKGGALPRTSDDGSVSCRCEEMSAGHDPQEVEAPPPKETAPNAAEPPLTTFLPLAEDEEPATEPSPSEASLVAPEVIEEELKQQIKAEMQESLEEEIDQKRRALQQQLEEIQALSRAEAIAAARAQVEKQVRKSLEAERAMFMEKLTESLAREKMKAEDEKLMVELYWMELKAHQLEEREKEMKKCDELYKQQVSKLEAKCAEFYKVSTENFQRGKEETYKRFARFNIQPLCGDVQGQILKCYKENPGRTLTCSRIASAYMQCVDNAKKDKVINGG